MAVAADLNGLAGQLNSVAGALSTLGVDMRSLQVTAAAFQAIGGVGQVITALISAKQAYNTMKAAEGAAHLAKYGPAAIAVAGMAAAGGYVIGELIERAINTDDAGGMRQLSGV